LAAAFLVPVGTPAGHNHVDQSLYYPGFWHAVLSIKASHSIKVPGRALAAGGRSGETVLVDARSALFDLYGDHLRARGGSAPVAALVRLLAALGILAPAVRTAVSRMSRQGWLAPVRLPEGAGYTLTPRAVRRLDEAAARIYSRGRRNWDGRWHLIVVERGCDRAGRDRLWAALGYLGYAQLDERTWISPRPSVELDALLAGERIRAARFAASYDGDPAGLIARAWDLDTLARALPAVAAS
jgi:phenylacetic acid degradation operon negative regulatory protein